ncbi:MAG: bifunctional folylpolyglutamate synthase/dihydrofolate synthase [Deltaproteobacteria bacterium]|nr:bifunctional folylpolyglutamate synthase/dihydrofolate synthase [Deltaproteobacteria bacterium]
MRDDLAGALRRLLGLSRFGMQLGLTRMERLLSALGRPERRFAAVHVAGTNGKGSTAAMVEACLREAGVRTGLYTSPHLSRFSERIRVGGIEIDGSSLSRWVERVLDLEPEATFFEAATAVAFAHFAEAGVELAVVEAGLGGRLDATNAILPLVSVISSIGLDHQEVLGPDLASIAAEKAGIIKPEVPVVVAPGAPEVVEVFEARAREERAPLSRVGQDLRFAARGGELYVEGAHLPFALPPLRLALVGAHQRENAALAIAALAALSRGGWPISERAIESGMLAARWPGRLEWIGETLLDCAHNPAGARALSVALEGRGDFCLVFGQLEDKAALPTLEALLPHARRVIFTEPRSPRRRRAAALAEELGRGETAPSLAEALALARAEPGPVLVTGSVYLVGEARELLLGETRDPLPTSDPR